MRQGNDSLATIQWPARTTPNAGPKDNTMFRNAILAAALAVAAWPALADPLPNGARPLGAKALHKLYSGTTLNWKTSRAWFAPDGTLKGVAGKGKLGETLFWGTWTVKGNEVCMSGPFRNRITGKEGQFRD